MDELYLIDDNESCNPNGMTDDKVRDMAQSFFPLMFIFFAASDDIHKKTNIHKTLMFKVTREQKYSFFR